MATNSLTFSLFGKDVSASKTMNDVAKSAEKAGGVFKGMATVAGGALAALGVTAGLSAVKDFLGDSVDAYKEAELAQTRLTDAYARFPAVNSVSIDSLRELNTELMNKTRFDDDALASGQSVLAQFGLTGEQLRDLTPLLADYAAKTGKDLPTAAEDLGKAVLGQGRALKGIGIDFQDTGSAAGNFEQLMSGLRSQVGGFATTEGAAGAGMAERIKNQFGEMQESIGSGLLPVLMTLQAAFLTYVVPVLLQLADVIGSNIGPAFDGFIAAVGPIIQQLGSQFGPLLSIIGPQIVQLATAFSPLLLILQALTPVFPLLTNVIMQIGLALSGVLGSAIPVVSSLMTQLASILSGVLASVLPIISEMLTVVSDVLLQLMPVISQVAGVLGSGLLMVFEALTPIIPLVAEVILTLMQALTPLIDPILQVVQAFLPLVGVIAELIATLLPPLIELVMAVLGPILGLVGPLVDMLVPALTWVADAISVVVGWISSSMIPIVNALVPVISNIATVLRNVFTGIADFVGAAFRNVANFIVGGINTVINLVNGAVDIVNGLGKAASDVSGGTISWHFDKLPKIPALAAGGIATAATLAVIGEGSEPEVVAPLSKLPGLMAAAGFGGGSDGPTRLVREDLDYLADRVAQSMYPLVMKGAQKTVLAALGG